MGSQGTNIFVYLFLSLPILCIFLIVPLYSIHKGRESIPKAALFALLLVLFVLIKSLFALGSSSDITYIARTILPILFIPSIILSFSYCKLSIRSIYLLAFAIAVLQASLCLFAIIIGSDSADQRLTSLPGYGSLTTSSVLFSFAFFLHKAIFHHNHKSLVHALQFALFIPVLIFIIMSQSAALLISSSMIFLTSLYLKYHSIFFRLVSISLGITLLVFISSLFLSHRLDEIISSTMLGRFDEVAAYLQLFQSHMLLGAPYAQRVFFFSLFEGDLNTGTVINPHNVFVFLLARQGLLGMILTVITMYYFYRSQIRSRIGCLDSTQIIFWLASALAILIYNLTSTSYTSPSFVITLILTLILSATASRITYPSYP